MKQYRYHSLTLEEIKEKEVYLERWRQQAKSLAGGSWYANRMKPASTKLLELYGHVIKDPIEYECGINQNPELGLISFVYYEDPDIDMDLFAKGALFIFGDDFVQRCNAQWIIIEHDGVQDYAITHEAFDEPVVLRLLQEYCNPQDLGPEDYADQEDYAPHESLFDPADILESAYYALWKRIWQWKCGTREFDEGVRIKRPLRASMGIKSFPPL